MRIIYFLRNLLVSAALVFAGLEAVLAVVHLPKDYKEHSMPTQFETALDPLIGYTNRRSASIDFVYDRNPRGYFHDNNTVEHVTNSGGFRGAEIPFVPLASQYRILFLGDSITFGEGVYFEDTYPEQFKSLAESHILFGKPIESINLGVGGYNTANEFALLEKAIHNGLRPEHVIVGYTLNDAEAQLFIAKGKTFTRNLTQLASFSFSQQGTSWWGSHFRSVRIVHNWFVAHAIMQQTTAYYHALYKAENPSFIATKTAIQAFGDFQKKSGIPVTFVVFPSLFNLDHYPFMAEQQAIEDELTRNHLGFVEVLPLLRGYQGPELWVHPTDQHPNEIVHRVVARAMVEYFLKMK